MPKTNMDPNKNAYPPYAPPPPPQHQELTASILSEKNPAGIPIPVPRTPNPITQAITLTIFNISALDIDVTRFAVRLTIFNISALDFTTQ